MSLTDGPEALQPLIDLTLRQCMERWGVRSVNAIKGRAFRLGVELRRDPATRAPVWPGEALALGDRLDQHLRQPGARMATFRDPEARPPVIDGIADGSDDDLAPVSAVNVADTDGPAMLAALVTALQQAQPPAPQLPPDPLAVARALGDAAALGAWLTTAEAAQLLRVSPGTVRSWADGHQPRPGFRLDRRREGPTVWWRVTAATG